LAEHFLALGVVDEAVFELHALAGAMIQNADVD